MLASDLRIDGNNAIAVLLQEAHDAIGRPARPIRCTDDCDCSRAGQKLGDVLVTGKGHAASTAQWTGVSKVSRSFAAIAVNASASLPFEAAGGLPASDASRIASDKGRRPRNGTPISFAAVSAPPVPNGWEVSPQCGQ